MLFYVFAVSGVGPDNTGVQMRKLFRWRTKSALGHDTAVVVVPPEHPDTVRTLDQFARAFATFTAPISDGANGRKFLIRVDLFRLKKFCGASKFATSDLANFIRRVIEDLGWKIEGESIRRSGRIRIR